MSSWNGHSCMRKRERCVNDYWYGHMHLKKWGIKRLLEVLWTYIMYDMQLIELINPPPSNNVPGYKGITLSVQICVHYITFFFYIGLPYLAHGCIVMRQNVAYIYDPIRCWPLITRSNLLGWWHGFVFWQQLFFPCYISHICLLVRVSPWYVPHTLMTSVWPWFLNSISKLYFHHKFGSCKIVFAF